MLSPESQIRQSICELWYLHLGYEGQDLKAHVLTHCYHLHQRREDCERECSASLSGLACQTCETQPIFYSRPSQRVTVVSLPDRIGQNRKSITV